MLSEHENPALTAWKILLEVILLWGQDFFFSVDSKNVLKFWKSFRKTPTPDISFVNFRSRNWTHDLRDHPIDGIKHSSSRPLTDIKEFWQLSDFNSLSQHIQNHTTRATPFSKLQLFPYHFLFMSRIDSTEFL